MSGWHEWMAEFGYLALFAGTVLEGETVVLAGSWLAREGTLSTMWVAVIAAAGAFTGDQIYFRIGASGGRPFLEKRPHLHHKTARVRSLLHRHRRLLMSGFRLVPGSRMLVPVVLGSSGVRHGEFALFNLAGCLVWALVVTFAGLRLLEAVARAKDLLPVPEWAGLGFVFLLLMSSVFFHWSPCPAGSSRNSGVDNSQPPKT